MLFIVAVKGDIIIFYLSGGTPPPPPPLYETLTSHVNNTSKASVSYFVPGSSPPIISKGTTYMHKCYPTYSNPTTILPPSLKYRYGAVGCVAGDVIWLLGGVDLNSTSELMMIDPAKQSWVAYAVKVNAVNKSTVSLIP